MKIKTIVTLAGVALSCAACEVVVIDRSTTHFPGYFPGYSRCVEWPIAIGTSNYSGAACPDGRGNFEVTPTTVPSYGSGIQPAPGRVEGKFVIDPFRKKE